MYLHKDREMFKDMVEQTAEQRGRTPIVVEKDCMSIRKRRSRCICHYYRVL